MRRHVLLQVRINVPKGQSKIFSIDLVDEGYEVKKYLPRRKLREQYNMSTWMNGLSTLECYLYNLACRNPSVRIIV